MNNKTSKSMYRFSKEIVNKYTLKCFKTDKVYNPNINLINRGKKDNQKLQYRRYSI